MARAARRNIPARVVFNGIRRTTLTCYAEVKVEQAELPRPRSSMSDLVAYGELYDSGKVPTTGTAGVEIATLLAELRELEWVPSSLNDVET